MTDEYEPTPEIRSALRRMLKNGEVTTDEVADAVTGRGRSRRVDARTREGRAWQLAAMRAGSAIHELVDAGAVVRVRSRRNVFFMTVWDAAQLRDEVTEALFHADESAEAPAVTEWAARPDLCREVFEVQPDIPARDDDTRPMLDCVLPAGHPPPHYDDYRGLYWHEPAAATAGQQ
jgi:hypothetical protein